MRSVSAVLFGLFVAVALAVAAKKPASELKTPTMDTASGKYLYQEVVTRDSTSAAGIYSRAKAWAANAYNSAQDVIQLDDAQSHTLILKGKAPIPWDMGFGVVDPAEIQHTLTIEAKDGRFRYSLTDLRFQSGTVRDDPLEQLPKWLTGRDRILDEAALAMESIVASLKAAMATPPTGNTDW